jgi:hypothetical protein
MFHAGATKKKPAGVWGARRLRSRGLGGVHAIRKVQNGPWELLMEIKSGLVVLVIEPD